MNPEDLAEAPPARLPFPVTRAVSMPVEVRADGEDDGIGLMTGRFSTFNDWYEVNSIFEGHFMERVAPSAFRKTVAESRSQMRTLYDHGQDPQIGNKVLGPIRDLGADASYAVPLFDTSYNRDLLPGLKAGVYGSSFRFTVEKDEWDRSPERSAHNPDGHPERTITEARVYEFGPVTFPANPNATAGVRSTTDTFYQRSRDPEQFESLLRSAQQARAPKRGPELLTLMAGTSQTVTITTNSTPVRAGAAAPPDEPPPVTPEGEPPEPDTPPAEPDQPLAAAPTNDPPEGGSSDSRSTPVEFQSIEEVRSRFDELNDSLRDQQAKYPVDMPEDEQVRYDADAAERDGLQVKIDKWEARQAKLMKAAEVPGAVERTYTPPKNVSTIVRKTDAELHSPETRSTTWEGREAEYRDDAKRILEKTSLAPNAPAQERTKDAIEGILDYGDEKGELARRIKYTSSPAYLRAFHKFITSRGETWGFTPEEQRGTALAVGVDGTGGFTVPFAFDPTVIAIGAWTGSVNPYRAACRVVTISGTDTWNALTSTAVVATRTTEAAAATEQGPTFAQPQYIVKRVQGQITASFEMFQDRTDLASEMSRLIQEAKDNEEEASWATGNGSGSASIGVGPVTGTSGSYTRVSTASGGTFAAADFDTLESNVPVRHRFRAQWFGNRLNIRRAQALETAGGKLFQQSQYFQSAGNVDLSRDGNTGLRLLGYPVNESPSLPTSTATTITGLVLLNVDQYVIVDRIGLQVQFIPFITNSSSLATGQQALYFIYRNHAAPLNTDSGRILQYL